MNDCSGQGTPTNGYCVCDAGFTGADCSADILDLVDGVDQQFTDTGIKWYYAAFAGGLTVGETFTLTITSDARNVDIYMSFDASE
mmetsp:Transcript_7112/g.5379  ORF Transcript_7112/g.5379 Transcript_7112/m.5379 type:complete len:85 (+) Transcript_7112:202-456(+)